MKHKNQQLEFILVEAKNIADLKMPGIVSLAVQKAFKQVGEAYKTYTEARKQTLESRCKKDDKGANILATIDENGNVLTDDQAKEYKGKTQQKYTFETDEIEKDALDQVKVIDEKEIEFNFDKVDVKIVEKIECTPAQMALIQLLIEM